MVAVAACRGFGPWWEGLGGREPLRGMGQRLGDLASATVAVVAVVACRRVRVGCERFGLGAAGAGAILPALCLAVTRGRRVPAAVVPPDTTPPWR
ncbi:hypothetical protein Airi02_062320 [Actinoallomurus iriomotensis]|uniref:Uncharacterized protein n=1 Tax=Actinoallomurus iriomotensis TaxID=478107 RepID=A0A9W6S717_9ACTN|nr:hypothetical protein Airi02_062320 [Actinoallomurus iriomotensis]